MATCTFGETTLTDSSHIRHRAPLVDLLKDMRNKQQYTDVTLVSACGLLRLPCHRVVLRAAGPYFKEMFSSGLKSATLQTTMDPTTLREVVDCIYGASVDITHSNAESLVEACDIRMLEDEDLKTRCHQVLVELVESSNCIRLFRFAQLHRLEFLQERARLVMLKEFESVSSTTEFKEMSFGEVVEYISDGDVNFQDDHMMQDAVQRWVDHDPQHRHSSKEILEHVRRPDNSTSVCGCGKMLRLVAIGGVTEDKSANWNCEYLKANCDSWQFFTEIPKSVRSQYSLCQVEDGMLLTGGQCWLYNTYSNKWTKTASQITPRCSHSSAALGKAVYVLGGIDNNNKTLASVERFDLKLHHWTVVPDMALALSDLMVAGDGNSIYAMGGLGAKGAINRCARLYDTKSGVWLRLTDMPKPFYGGAVIILHRHMYVVGGCPCSCLRYDMATDEWLTLQKPYLQHSFAPAVEWQGRILLAGGGNSEGYATSDVEQYDPIKDEWSIWNVQLMKALERHRLFKMYIHHYPYDTSAGRVPMQNSVRCRDTFKERIVMLRHDDICTDVTLVSGDVRIPCHRVVLAASCDYFNVMFSSNLAETTADLVRLDQVDPAILANIVTYLYTDEMNICTDNVQNLVVACDHFLLDRMKRDSEYFMTTQLLLSNCIEFYRFAQIYGLDHLCIHAKRMMCKQFESVASTTEFATITCSDLIKYIEDKEIIVRHEDIVLQAVLVWAMHDLDNRQLDLHRVLEHICLYHCTSYCLSSVLEDSTFLCLQCQRSIEKALLWHGIVVPRDYKLIRPQALRRRGCTSHRVLVVVGGLTRDERQCRDVQPFATDSVNPDTARLKLTQMPDLSSKFFSICYVEGGLLLIGSSLVWFYDMNTSKWGIRGGLLTPRFRHASVVQADTVYILGGTDDDLGVLDSVEQLNLVSRSSPHFLLSSFFVADMPQPVTHPMAVSCGNGLYVFGGINKDNTTSRCTRHYDTKCDVWRTLAEMPEECRLGAVVEGSDCMYVVGGSARSCLRFRPATDTWTILSRPFNVHSNAPAVGWNNRILLAGGDDAEHVATSGVEQYDPLQDEWSDWKTPLMQELSCHHLLNVEYLEI